ncbi:uncharacterized protein LOC114254672 [Monomorium pharaonis]|uniref:uncharacterized protein LOC114254672 n=1 Tax=Monomorium pharaonis TaxID=307658 RepID=UPI001746E6A3|nr:uncharacterized protein LOC114254672 [Monomorium pharaonis]XP_036148068.1 uncharacterized protein LOC114254672 [Monomorium pharaonis]
MIISLIMFSSLSKFQELVKNGKGKKLFHATDFQSLMYPCFTFCRILGIFPYNVNASGFRTSKPCYFLSIIIKCVSCFCALIIIINISEWYNIPNERKIIEVICTNILGNFIMVFTFVSCGPRIRLLQMILKISSQLPSEMYRKQSMLIHFKDIFGFIFLLVYTLICYCCLPMYFLLKVYLLYICLLMFQMDMLYINCVCVLKACFKRINDDLANLFINNKSSLIKWVNHEQKNSLLLIKLKTLKKQHLMISDIVKKLNIIFSPQLLATITFIFIHITFEIYFNIVQWQNGLSIGWTNRKYRDYVVPYIVYFLIKLALITWTCETGKNQSIKISTTVHDVLNITTNKKIKNEVLKNFTSIYLFFHIPYIDTIFKSN